MTAVVNDRDDFTLGELPAGVGGRRASRYRPTCARGDGRGAGGPAARVRPHQFIYGVTSSFGPRDNVTIPSEQQRTHADENEIRATRTSALVAD